MINLQNRNTYINGGGNMKRVAVIGYGGQGAWHCAQIKKSDVVSLAGVYDIKENRRTAAIQNDIFVHRSNVEIFTDKTVDIIVVATPNDAHEDLVIKGLTSGHHVICEKPVALSVKEFDRMLKAQNKSGKLLAVHQNRRWDIDYLGVKSIVNSGNIGDVIRIESRIHGSRGIPSDWRCEKVCGGGMILDWGVHLIDQMLNLIHEKIVSIYCNTTHITNKEVDDGFRLEITFASGKTGYVEVGTYNFLPLPRFYMQCEKGCVQLNDWQQKAKVAKLTQWIEKNVAPIQNAAGITKTMAPRDELTLDLYEIEKPLSDVHDFYRNFCLAADGKAEQLVKNQEARRVLCVMEAAFKSAYKKQRIKVRI